MDEKGDQREPIQKLTDRLMKEFQSGTIELPSLPEIVMRVRMAISDDNINLNKLARIIQADTNITARIVQIANSASYAHLPPVDSCHAAITRLGLRVVRDIVTCLAINTSFSITHAYLKKQVQQLWHHSREIAAISYVLASITPTVQPQKAMLAGLTHDIGVLPLLQYAEHIPELVNDPVLLKSSIATLRGPIGSMILRKWNFDDDMVMVPKHAEDWYREADGKIDYSDIVIVAQLHSIFGEKNNPETPNLVDIPAFRKLPVSQLGPNGSLEVLHQAREEIRSMTRVLAAG